MTLPPPLAAAPALFDRALTRARLARSFDGERADFLLARAADDLETRLSVVARQFSRALDLGTPTGHAVGVLRAGGRAEAVFRAAPLPMAEVDAVCDADRLPIAPESVDLVVSLLALQSLDDLPGALAQIRRALRPDGLFLACLLGGRSLQELREAFAIAEAEIEGGVSPRVAPFADVRDMGGLLQRAGFALPVADVDNLVVRYATPLTLMADLRAMGLTNTLVERRRVPLRRATLMRMLAVYHERFADPDGRVRASFDLVWVSGWAPHESQPKPLKPGSATMRLADALAAARAGKADPGGSGEAD